jgi:hypothetical protein
MKPTDLQLRLVQLAPGETLLIGAADIKQAFLYMRTPETRHAAATALLY